MLSAESGRKRMGVYLEDWDSCFAVRAERSFPPSVASTPSLSSPSDNLVPLPLRPRFTSQAAKIPSHSPPLSPTPPVFVSLQLVEPGKIVPGNLSLHRYRESLSHSRPDLTAQPPARSLKRKPKALNLNTNCTSQAPPSPPPTPPSPSAYSGSSDSPPSPAQPAGEYHYPRLTNVYSTDYLATPAPTSVTEEFVVHAKASPEYHAQRPVSNLDATRPSSQINKLNAFCKHIRQIPARIFRHSTPASEISPSSSHFPRTLHHRGVSFEILSPQKWQSSHPHSSTMNIEPELTGLENMTSPYRPRAQSRSRSQSLDGRGQRTPSRTLFDDLETAHSSITSRLHDGGNRALTTPPRDASQNQSSPSLSNKERREQAAIQLRADFGSHKCVLARHVSTDSPLRAAKRADRQRKPIKLIKHRPGSRLDQMQTNTSPHTPPRKSASPVLGTFFNQYQPSLNGIRGRVDKSTTIDNIIKSRLNMFDTRLKNSRFSRLQRSRELQADTKKYAGPAEGLTSNPVRNDSDDGKDRHERAYQCEESVDCPGMQAPTPPNHPQGSTHELVPPSQCRQGTGASSPNFSRPIPPGKWLSTRRFSPFKPISRSSVKATSKENPQDRVRSPTHVQSNQEVQRENEESIMKLLSHQSASVAREIERGLFRGSDSHCDESDPIDLGPGSSQSSSTQHLSQHMGSSTIFPSPLRVSSVSSSHFSEQGPGNPFFHGGLGTRSLTKRSESGLGRNRRYTHTALDKHAETLASEGIQEEVDDADRDWETVAGSQQFTSSVGNGFGQADTETSLADYSSFGNLANSNTHKKSPLRSSRVGIPTTSHGTNAVTVPAYAGRHSHFFHKDPSTGQYVLLPNTNYRNSEGSRLNAFRKPIPALIASTSKSPTPFPNKYHHPSPLSEAHTNPFRSTPPLLHCQPGQSDEPENDGRRLTTVGNSKSNFHDNVENTYISHRGYGHCQRNPNISESARASFQHWFSEVIGKDPAQRSSQSSSAFHWDSRNIGPHNSADASSLNISKVSTIGTDDNISTNPLSVNLDCHPCFRPYHTTIQLPSHGDLTRENPNVPSRSLSTDRLLPAAPESSKYSPGSLYHSIRSARDRILGGGQKRKSLNNTLPSPIQESTSQDASPRPASTGLLERHIPRQGTVSSRSFSSRSILLRTPTMTRRSSTGQTARQPTADELLRERLEQMDPALLADFCQPSPNSRLSRATWEPQVYASGQETTRPDPLTAPPRNAFDEESALPPEGHFDHHAFPDSPRLNPIRKRAVGGGLVEQRRLGRKIILWCTLAFPLGWTILLLIGYGSGQADFLIQRWSDGNIDGFHEKEERLARQAAIAYVMFLLIGSIAAVSVALLV
ncbi:uncharacterized protein CIMG_01658 [Coccidioides immitis RS]|uniref:Uncharacterized protein n=1 Tax=Coccidioides immitis (strain RS) TaxID=246410 RepID=A0A0E1RYV3_COCIM|nr:uncharacterized protein CIMG_01658 [Coccidioides immitis RS]EAS36304.2 hypothetical protein CIMG_01658 [Coccidioides immitis RS]